MISFGKRGGRGSSEPDMTPMIDMLFILMVFFVITSFFLSPVFHVNPPSSDTASESQKNDLVVELDSSGRFYLEDRLLTAEELENTVKERLSGGLSRDVYIRADKETPFEQVVFTVDLLNKAGADEIGFIVQKKQ